MSRIILVGVFFLLIMPASAQHIQVLTAETYEPVADAMIYDENKTTFTITDELGLAKPGIFGQAMKLLVQHPSYHSTKFTIGKNNNDTVKIFLKEKIIRIDEIVVSANKWEQNTSEIPFEILSINAKEIEFVNPQTSADLLEASGQVFVQKSQLGGGSPMLRGFGANSVLLVVDGVRMNNTIFRSGNLQNVINIDPNALESSEVIFGPGAVIYGSDALGGVMDFHTISPTFNTEGGTEVHGSAMARYSTANQEKTGNAILRIGKKNVAYVGSFTIGDFDDLQTGSVRPADHPDFGKRPEYVIKSSGSDSIIQNSNENLQRFSGYRQLSTLQKIAFRVNKNLELGYTFNYSTTTNIPRYDRLTEYDDENLKYADWYYGPQEWMMNAIKLKSYKSSTIYDAFKLTAAFQTFRESRHDRRYRETLLRNRTEKVNAISVNGDFEKAIDKQNQLFYGGEYVFNHVNSTAYAHDIETEESTALSTRYPGGGSDVHSLALYASLKRNINERFFLNAGLRLNYQHLYARFLSEDFPYDFIKNVSTALNGNIGLVYQPNEQWNISGMFSTGFRAPNIDDISKVFDSEPGNVVVPNPDLKPEYSYNGELTVHRYFGKNASLSGTVFYSLLRNAMVRGDFEINGQDSINYDGELSRVQAIVNTQKANIYGFNIFLRMNLAQYWSGAISFNYIEGRDLLTSEPLRHTTPAYGITSIKYNREKITGEFFVRFNGKRSFADLPPSERNKPQLYSSDGSLAWYTLNMRASYRMNEIFNINIALENIIDRHYRTYSSGISAPGRNLILSLKATF